MTPEQIRAKAIEAAGFEVFALISGEQDRIKRKNELISNYAREIARAAIDAYEAAMKRPAAEVSEKVPVLIWYGERPVAVAELADGRWWVRPAVALGMFDLVLWKGHPPTHFSPLPQPPTQ